MANDTLQRVVTIVFLLISLVYSVIILLSCQWYLVYYRNDREIPPILNFTLCNNKYCQHKLDKMGIYYILYEKC